MQADPHNLPRKGRLPFVAYLAMGLVPMLVIVAVLESRSAAEPNPTVTTSTPNSVSATTTPAITAPDKWPVEDYYSEYRALGEENRATEPPSAPAPSPPPAYETGIVNGSDAPFSTEDVRICNRWQGYLPDGDFVVLYAGEDSNGSGILILDGPNGEDRRGVPAGRVCVAAVDSNDRATVSADGGETFIFDIPSGNLSTATTTIPTTTTTSTLGNPATTTPTTTSTSTSMTIPVSSPRCRTAAGCLSLLRKGPLCATGGSVRLQEIIDKKLRVAATRLASAISAKKPKKARQFVAAARRPLTAIDAKAERFEGRKNGAISSVCKDTIFGDIALVTAELDANRL